MTSKTSVSFTFILKSESCLLSYFVSPMTRGQLEVGWIFVSLILSFTILFLLLCYQSSNTTLFLWESTRAVFLCNNVMNIHKFEWLVKNRTLFSNKQHLSFFRNHASTTLQYIQVRRVSDSMLPLPLIFLSSIFFLWVIIHIQFTFW